MEDLRNALDAVRLLQNTTGSKAKQEVLVRNAGNEYFRQLIYYACHPRLTYKVSETTLNQRCRPNSAITQTFTTIFDICSSLSHRKAIDDVTLYQVLTFLELQTPEDRVLYQKLLAKTLRLGVTAKSINKAIPGLIPEWEVQQAYPIEKYPLKDGVWFSVSQKLNGVRATFYDGKMIARSGAIMPGLDHIVNELEKYPDFVYDGEITLKDKGELSDNEAFRITTGILNGENGDKTRVCFTIFDMLPEMDFDRGYSTATYRTRRRWMDELAKFHPGNENVSILPSLYAGTDQSVIAPLLDRMVAEDKEGLMVNLDVPYQCRRHSGILKVKRFYTVDLPIVRVEPGTGRCSDVMGSIVVDFIGAEVGVGSGFTDEQRKWFWEHREDVIGTLAEIKYKEISFDKDTSKRSLQFPVFVALRTDKDDVSFG